MYCNKGFDLASSSSLFFSQFTIIHLNSFSFKFSKDFFVFFIFAVKNFCLSNFDILALVFSIRLKLLLRYAFKRHPWETSRSRCQHFLANTLFVRVVDSYPDMCCLNNIYSPIYSQLFEFICCYFIVELDFIYEFAIYEPNESFCPR